ncbi:MAG: GNAT family N-acetyltransferase [Firmicutes bacterium]|nr:GNAT family N-acetyltransferase [Bacillota bacterium]
MNITIQKAKIEHLSACVDALLNSELGRQYFTQQGATRELTSGISKEEVYAALSEDGNCLGFVWGRLDAAFHIYPYMHLVAVRAEYRGKGVGKQLIEFCENVVFASDSKVFLVVADFSLQTKKLYEKLGYTQVGELPDLYSPGVTEYLMMKNK